MTNYPPGVTEGMIPGNRPEDVLWDMCYELLEDELSGRGLDVPDIEFDRLLDAVIRDIEFHGSLPGDAVEYVVDQYEEESSIEPDKV